MEITSIFLPPNRLSELFTFNLVQYFKNIIFIPGLINQLFLFIFFPGLYKKPVQDQAETAA
ncbi:MAG: hypothetical protein B6230_04075 [Desulfobacteraceae bacterium 4572_89]|nr:MAG: hypothetical protein B6230_04075 [Desulfobacteraceae bacterium 4572_89]